MIKCSKNIRSSCIVITKCFSLFVRIVKEKKCYQAHVMNLLLFLILESVSMIVLIRCKNMTIIFSKSVTSDIFVCSNSFILYWKKTFQEMLYTAVLNYLLWYIRLKNGQKLDHGGTVAYSCDLNLRINYFCIVSFHLYAWEICH